MSSPLILTLSPHESLGAAWQHVQDDDALAVDEDRGDVVGVLWSGIRRGH